MTQTPICTLTKPVLLISENQSLCRDIRSSLDDEGLKSINASEHVLVSEIDPLAVILDIQSGHHFEVCRHIRETSTAPLIGLTDGGYRERIRALAAGADDCMTHPISTDELIARVNAVLACRARRGQDTEDEKGGVEHGPALTMHDLRIDVGCHEVTIDGSRLDLTSTEFNLLALLAENRGHAVSRRKLLAEVWGNNESQTARAVDTHICRLRRKLGRGGRPGRLASVKGVGDRLQ